MQSAKTLRVWLTACAVVSMLAGCKRTKGDTATETGSVAEAGTGDAGNTTAVRGKMPLSTESAEAKKLYGDGLAMFDQVKFHDACEQFLKAAAKDPNFAMAHYQLAITTPSPKEAREHVKHAVALADKASQGERLQILGLEAAFNGDPSKSLEYAKEASQKYPDDERLHQ